MKRVSLRMIPLVLATSMLTVLLLSFTVPASGADSYPGYALIQEWAKKEYMGRQTGTPGYAKATDDLEKRMRETGMVPLFGEGQYRQSFQAGTAELTSEKVLLNKRTLKLMKDYMPFSRSAAGSVSLSNAYYVGGGLSSDYTSKTEGLVVFHWFDKNGKFPEGALDRVQRAIAKGAKAVIIIANGELKVGNYEHPLSAEKLSVPVIYLTEDAAGQAGIPLDFVPKKISGVSVQIDMEIDRSDRAADNLVGVVPGKSESKAILWVTNIDGFGSLPDGTWFESAKSGAASAAMMLDMAGYYRKNVPEYTMIFAFVGSKWKAQEGIRALTDALNFDRIASVVDLYSMGGNGSLNEMYFGFTDPSFESFAKAVSEKAVINNDLGNALFSVLKSKTKNLIFIRDQNTWVDDSLTDKASNVGQGPYSKGVESLLTTSTRIMNRLLAGDRASIDYSQLSFSAATLQNVPLSKTETKHFHVYADESNKSSITPAVLKEMDAIYERVAFYNYYPLPQTKVNALFMKDGNLAAKLSGRKDLESDSSKAGGGFANYSDGQMYMNMRLGPAYETISHELNHALASANPYAGTDQFELQEWQGQSDFVRYLQVNGQMVHPDGTGLIVQQRFLANHEVPKLKDLVANYKKEIDWNWFTKQTPNPNGHLYTYYLMGSMYAFLSDRYGEKVSRRAMYRNYIDVAGIRKNLIQDTGLTLDSFLEQWSRWMLQPGSSSASRQAENNGFDYRMLFTEPTSGGEARPGKNEGVQGALITNGTVRYSLSVSSKDLKIVSLNLFKTKDGATFEIAYESKAERFVSLFNPPDGDKLMKYMSKAIVPGKGKVAVKLSNKEVDLLRNLSMVTLRFGNGEDFAFIGKEEYIRILK